MLVIAFDESRFCLLQILLLVISVATLDEITPYRRVTLFVSLPWMTERFSPIFSAKKVISDALKVGFRTLHEVAAEAFIIIVAIALASLSPWQQ